MKHFSTAILLTAFAFCACDSPGEKEVHDRIQQYYTDFSNRDWEAFENYFYPSATLTTIWQKPGDDTSRVHITPLNEFLANTDQGPDSQPIFQEWMKDFEVRIEGDLAQAWVHYGAKFGTEEELMEWEGIDAFTLLKYNGEWKIVSIAYTDINQ